MVEDLEKAGLLIAAAVHDLDHMGRTSSFLVNAEHPLALLYNDMSVCHISSRRFVLLLARMRCQGGHKPGKPGILRDFSEHGKVRD